jgi:tripartite-type tricarboxylate transporter receptor subunit TctC
VTLIVPQPAGGATDVSIRALAAATEKHLGKGFVIENRPGAGGTLGTTVMAATAKPDGYTLSATTAAVFRLPFLTKTTFDPISDLTYIIGVSGFLFGAVVRADARWRTFQELLSYAKANPGKITFGSPGAGSLPHITMEQIAKQQGFTWVHVPFRGNAESNTALMGAHVDVVADGSGWGPLVNDGKFRLLVIFGSKRAKSWPNVPTLKEVGIDMEVNGPYGITGPKRMDPMTVKILHDAFKKGMGEQAFAATLQKLEQDALYMSSEDYRNYAIEQVIAEKQMVEELGLKVE